MYCWWCYWGWPKEIKDIFDEAVDKLDGLDCALRFGPAHCVWEDENWHLAEYQIEDIDNGINCEDMTKEELAIVRESLVKLAALPDEFKHEPKGYEDNQDNFPKDFPPPKHWVMIKCE